MVSLGHLFLFGQPGLPLPICGQSKSLLPVSNQPVTFVCDQPGSLLPVCGSDQVTLGHPINLTHSPCVQHCPCPLLLFSVLGMFLFGGKFCIRADGSGDCTCQEILDPESGCVCTRMHFNNFLWATVTVFQVSYG